MISSVDESLHAIQRDNTNEDNLALLPIDFSVDYCRYSQQFCQTDR